MTYEIIRLDLWMGHGLDFVILFFTIIVCFLHILKTLGSMIFGNPLTIHSKQVRYITRIDPNIVYILFLTVNIFYATRPSRVFNC